MPLYEYVCPDDGETITLLRPMSAADDPVDDPEDRGRTFLRTRSTFAVGAAAPDPMPRPGPGCGCGNPYGPCAPRG